MSISLQISRASLKILPLALTGLVLHIAGAQQAYSQTAAEQAMTDLEKQWYNALTKGLGLEGKENRFQVMQGVTSLGETSDVIWNFFDSVPPKAISHLFDPAQFNRVSQDYGAVINNLIPQNQDDLQKLLKDKYVSWEKFQQDPKNNPSPLPKDSDGNIDIVKILVDKFTNWALSAGLEPGTINAGLTLLKQKDVITVAINQWVAADGKYAYTATQTSLTNALDSGQSKDVSLDSKTTSTDTTHAFAGGSVSGAYDFFFGKAGGQWDKFTQEIHQNGLKLSVKYGKVATLTGGPYAVAAPTNPSLLDYVPWFNSAALQTAKANNNKVWKHGAPTWEQTFGDDGNLSRLAVALIVVDGVESTMTSTASVSKQNRQSFEAAFKAGFWPFFSVEGKGGWSHNVTFNDDGSFVVKSSSKEGNPQVVGILVDPIDAVIGNQ